MKYSIHTNHHNTMHTKHILFSFSFLILLLLSPLPIAAVQGWRACPCPANPHALPLSLSAVLFEETEHPVLIVDAPDCRKTRCESTLSASSTFFLFLLYSTSFYFIASRESAYIRWRRPWPSWSWRRGDGGLLAEHLGLLLPAMGLSTWSFGRWHRLSHSHLSAESAEGSSVGHSTVDESVTKLF